MRNVVYSIKCRNQRTKVNPQPASIVSFRRINVEIKERKSIRNSGGTSMYFPKNVEIKERKSIRNVCHRYEFFMHNVEIKERKSIRNRNFKAVESSKNVEIKERKSICGEGEYYSLFFREICLFVCYV